MSRRVVAIVLIGLWASGATIRSQQPDVYRPRLAVPEFLQPFLKDIEPGNDSFPLERDAVEIEGRLRALGDALRKRPLQLSNLVTADFRGARLVPDDAAPRNLGVFEVRRIANPPQDIALNAKTLVPELRKLVDPLREITAAEFDVTSIEPQSSGLTRTDVRYDIVGIGTNAWRVEHVGVWKMTWRKSATGWQIAEWTAQSLLTTVAKEPVFTEVTGAVLGGNESFARQLGIGLDDWMATFDSVLTRDSNGHHGVSVGDADGDGLDDLYVAQPSGLPNRLYRARGDSTFEDITERAGLGVLDDTAQSLFVDIDNDGDEDLVLSTGTRPLLFVNEGKGRFSPRPDAFQFERPLQGVLTSIAMADYDRDGFLDLYLCVYSYFFGAGEDKAGTPMPYYDARNGPPGVLFRNDGKGRFVDVTRESGLEAGNDRYHFAAAWADYDGDGWQDLLVANDFGTKNLYRNRGAQNGKVTFEDVSAAAGVLDHGAGMSAAFFDYDNDGLLDIYTGNMWSPSGLRVTSAPTFMPDASPEVRALYQRHARGNGLFRNAGKGRFEDRTLEARANIGRWAWSSDTLDFDSDGWDDLFIVNGMLTREKSEHDLDGFFWRQVVARSPLTLVKGTPYDDAWRAINQRLIHESIASHQRNVFLRNDGQGGFDEVSGAVGLDLDQDGRSFAVLDIDRDGDPDLAVMAARQAPQLRVFRNDFVQRGGALAIRLAGTRSNRDAVGARVTIETDRLRKTRIVQAGSGFISQHSKELLVGLGPSTRVLNVTVEWPSGGRDVFSDIALNSRVRIVEGGAIEKEPFRQPAPLTTAARSTRATVPDATWLYEPFPAPEPSLDGLKGRPAAVLLWSNESAAARSALDALTKGKDALAKAGIGSLAIEIDSKTNRELGLSYAILNRHVFMNRQDVRLPTMFLLDQAGNVVRAYRDRVDIARTVRDSASIDAPADERLKRALPFAGTFYSPLAVRNYVPYGRELLNEGLESAAVVAFDRAARANPSASTLYYLGTLLAKSGQADRARASFERALAIQPDLAEANNDLGALLAQDGQLDAAIERFRAAIAAAPDYPDALNNLGYALLLSGQDEEARSLYEKALALQPDFPEALNNLGMLYGRGGDLDAAERYFRDALTRRPDYGEAANNLSLVLVARGQPDAAIQLLEGFLAKVPQFENAYVTLAKIHFSADRRTEGIRVLERLLQRNPTHPAALELLRQWKP
jgi:Flp pilus assembly protein TadD